MRGYLTTWHLLVLSLLVVGLGALPGMPASAAGRVPPQSASAAGSGGGAWTIRTSGTGFKSGPVLPVLSGVSCPTTGACVAVGPKGAILTRADDGSSWTTVPPVTGQDLVAVACSPSGTCVAVGTKGTIITGAAGSWTIRPSGTTHTLDDIACPTATHCVIVGDNGTVLTSDDAGASWTSHPIKTTLPLLGISCPNMDFCVAVGELGQIARSVDGGASWTVQAYTDSGYFGNGSLSGVSCSSNVHCIAVGMGRVDGTILTSDDSGTHWTRRESGTDQSLAAVDCLTGTSCLIVGTNGTLLSSGDSGHTWSIDAPGTNFDLVSISCADAHRCVLVGGYDTGGIILSTTDGGATWAANDGANLNPNLSAVSCRPSGPCVVVGDHGTILTSGTGVAWTNRSLDSTHPNLLSVSCASAGPCVAAGEHGLIVAGDTAWVTEVADTGPVTRLGAETFSSVSCWGGGRCVLVGNRGSVLTTRDSGSNWTVQVSTDSVSIASGGLTDVSCTGEGRCVAVGEDSPNLVLSISDRGVLWASQDVGSQRLTGVSCQSGGRCVAVGLDGAILISSDSGATWRNVKSGTAANLWGVTCTATGACVAVGNGTILHSGDGGHDWFAQLAGTRQGLDGVSCRDGSSCVIVGTRGTILTGAVILPTDAVPVPRGISAGMRYFPATGHTVKGAFLTYYAQNNGLKLFGLPLTDAFIDGGQTVQYFERVRLVFAGGRIGPTPLGSQITANRHFAAASCCGAAGQLWFGQTRHTLGDPFLTFWKSHHGATLFGSPISQLLLEQNGDGTGRTYTVQYFQNGRLEYHAELAGTPAAVQVGQLGREALHARGWA